MKYIKFTCSNGYCGCDEEFYETFNDDVTEDEIEDVGEDLLNNLYGFYEPDDRFVNEEDFDTEEDYLDACDEYSAECSVSWEEISKKEFEENT